MNTIPGWKLVPVEATPEMIAAVAYYCGSCNTDDQVYRVMIEAAPVPPEPSTVGEQKRDDRAAFEAWARSNGQSTERDEQHPEYYDYGQTDLMWCGWQARAALASPAPDAAALVEAVRSVAEILPGIAAKVFSYMPGHACGGFAAEINEQVEGLHAALAAYDQQTGGAS